MFVCNEEENDTCDKGSDSCKKKRWHEIDAVFIDGPADAPDDD